MAEYDRRGGGGGGGHYNNRKRRFRDHDEDNFRQQRRRRYDVPVPVRIRRQLLSLAESPLRRWADDAVSLARLVAEYGVVADESKGENGSNGADNTTTNGGGDGAGAGQGAAYVRESFVPLVAQLVAEQPLKTPFVAGVLLVVNAMQPAIVEEVLRHEAAAVEAAIASGRWRDVKLHLRLLGCLQTCLVGDGVFPLLDKLFARAVDLQTASSDDVVGTELVKIILLTIPYVMAATAPDATTQQHPWHQLAADLMEKTDVIASEPHALQKLMDPYLHKTSGGGGEDITNNDVVDDDDDDDDYQPEEDDDHSPVPTESALGLLQKQLQAEAAKGWPLACLPRPWNLPLEDIELQAKLDDPMGTKHELPQIVVPDTVVAGTQALFPEVYVSVYGAGVERAGRWSVPGVTEVAATLIRDSLVDTINVLDFNRTAAARFLIDVDCYFADGTFIKRATPFDRLRDVEVGRSTWKPEDVAVDAVFAQILQLPAAEHKLVYYHAVLAEACKIAPAAIAPSLGRAIRYLYRHSHRMDLELFVRFVDWFSHHLSNFGFTWKWTEWVDDAGLPALHPHKAFVVGAVDKEIRLSFAQRIKNTLPPAFQAVIGPETERDVPVFKFAEPEQAAGDAASGGDDETGGDKTGDKTAVAFAAEGRELAALLRRKAADDEVQAVIERIHSQALDSGLDPLVASTDVFTTAVLWTGAKSLSHVLACIERTKDRLLDAGAASEAARAQILTAVMAFWAAHPGIAMSIAEKLLNYGILSPSAVVQWALGGSVTVGGVHALPAKRRAAALGTPYVIELVLNTVAKVTRRVRHVVATADARRAAIVEARAALDAARASADDLDVAMDDDKAAAAEAAAETATETETKTKTGTGAGAAAGAEEALAAATAAAEAADAAEKGETQAMRDLFRQIEDAVVPWTTWQGEADNEAMADDAVARSAKLVRAWAVRWQRAVQRQKAVEEAFLADAEKSRRT